MNREIKFRAWNGERMRTVNTICFSEGWVDTPKENSPIEDFVLMQYTGLEDVNFNSQFTKSEIIGVVKYCDINPTFMIEYKFNGYGILCHEYDFVQCGLRRNRVIGNIYENPELI